MNHIDARFCVQFITSKTSRYSHFQAAQQALNGGCRWVQLRMKDEIPEQRKAEALNLQALCSKEKAIFIIDDDVELVRAIKADGVHLGKNDMLVSEARQILGNDFIIGGTANTIADVENLIAQGVDYVGCGPYRFTTTKKNLSPILGLQGYVDIQNQLKQKHLHIPMVAIGGIGEDDLVPILQTGVEGIALSGSVLRAKSPSNEMNKIVRIIEQNTRK